jgi:transcription initiation factor TFIIH subunit 2
VVINEDHFKDLLFECVPPPAVTSAQALQARKARSQGMGASLILMGFPSMTTRPLSTLCSCHGRLKSHGFTCPRCKSQICEIPTDCGICGLTVVSSPHLARSYRHLFPVKNFAEVACVGKLVAAWC